MNKKPWGIYDSDNNIIFEPSDKQRIFLESTKPYILYGGSRGSGKSFAAIFKAIFTCLKIPQCNVCIVRKTYVQLEQSIISQFNLLPQEIYSDNKYAFNHATNIVTFDNGSKLYFRSCANVDVARNLFKGSSFVCILVDEGTEFSYAEWLEMMGGNRCAIKYDIYGDPVICQLISLSNPGSIGHTWTKSLFVDKMQVAGQDPDSYDPNDYEFVKALVEDNPVYGKDKDYLKKLEALPAALRAAYRYGDWSVFSGQYYSNFDINANIIDEDIVIKELKKQSWQPRWMSIDWGASQEHWAVALWHTTLKINDITHVITYRELICNNIGESAFAQEIVTANNGEKLNSIFIDPACGGDGRTPQKLIGDVFVANDMIRPILASNERVPGWRLIYNMLDTRPKSELQISTACHELIKSIPMLIRNSPTKPEDVKKMIAQADDIGDCWRYGIYSYMKPKLKPDSIEYQERLATINDPTQRNIFTLMEKEKNKKKQKGFTLR